MLQETKRLWLRKHACRENWSGIAVIDDSGMEGTTLLKSSPYTLCPVPMTHPWLKGIT